MNAKHTKILQAIFAKPTASSLRFADIESLVVALGGSVREGDGSRVALHLGGFVKHAHRPHPGKDECMDAEGRATHGAVAEAKKYQIEEIRLWLEAQGIRP